ncbi:pilus assembly protein [Massilia yuzhufengensis]|uniref:Type IV pilus assembly protein PilY1 n=1 Tax=Massilia yuzhufengensis TaxID=1164594 RepID=A0A1I1JCG0_9BURK|nr:PilC/PilY family type IV pilus protein [Massilia yuzhufengensis]SFC46234.1 type IV pilus assembly protein PilY1 [Massilia yuzhufengensis]
MNRLISRNLHRVRRVLLPLLALACLVLPARAEPTAIANLPLLNMTGSGTVKPNLMLLYDNSGSMSSTFTPDYVDDTSTCRGRATMAGGSTRGCRAGDPPFASPDFNRQYYDPRVRYSPPVKADGSSYASQDRTTTTNWTSVTTDGFGVNAVDLQGQSSTRTNLVTGFPDLKWCDTDGNNCNQNRSGYLFPSDERYTAASFTANPYYYLINVAEYCTDASLTNCRVTAVNAAAPSGYPFAARVRWCDSRALTNCQAKYVGNFKYPRYSDPNRPAEWYGTVTIGASSGSASMTLNSVTATYADNSVATITNVGVTAASGTNTAAKQQAVANAVAASIIAKTGLAQPYTACVKTPTGGGVPACSSFGIILDTTNVVAVVPISCPAGATSKAVPNCTLLSDGSRAGVELKVSSGTSSTALLAITGSTNPSKTQVLSQLTFGGVNMFSASLSLGRGVNAAAVALAIRNQIGTRGTVRAYVGGASGSGTICSAAPNTTVCLVDTGPDAEGKNIGVSLPTNNSSKPGYLGFSITAAVSDGIPASATDLGASVFVRTDIVSTRTSYPKGSNRIDCSAATACSYDEEMTNFANWYAYYKTRNQMMKTTVGHAFQPISDNYNVGLTSLSSAAAEGAMTRPDKFSGTHRTTWYKNLYEMNGNQSTPIRQALHAIGKLYANQYPYNYTGDNQVVKFPCQQNFTIVTTDGYWNGNAAADVVSNDNTENLARFCQRSKGCVDPSTQSANSLADVALYWYNGGSSTTSTSLRPTMEDWTKPGLVPAAPGENTRLHMKTYTLGLGVDGIMNYEPNYDTAAQVGGDFYKLITGVTSGCPWNGGGAYVWPDPKTGDNGGSAAYQSRVDDLWHAAINGHGKYFSASDPLQVVAGLRSALSNIEVKAGAAAASATSTPNVSQYDNDIFSATFTTVKWYGQLTKRKINIVTGIVEPAEAWNSSTIVGRKVGRSSDTRRILMLDTDTTGSLKDFDYADMNAQERGWFDNKCNLLSQCANLSGANQAIVNSGATIVNWLRGQQQYADNTVLRSYAVSDTIPQGLTAAVPLVLGDIASAKPAFVRDPRKMYTRAGYNDFKVTHASRAGAVYVAANDGMLHAFASDDGEELWAYVPRITMKKLPVQASINYGVNHQYTVDGSPEVADVQIGGEWRTVLVGGLNAGGRGYYALDVTNPEQPRALWELCADATVCAGINHEPEIGLSFGNAQFGLWKNASGAERWVVFLTSAYNNIPGVEGVNSGSGKGYLFVVDVATGQVLDRITTNTGSTTTPSGFAKITAITTNPSTDPLVTYVYGGDNLGQMWRFDFTSPGTVRMIKMGDAGAAQPITTRPDVALCRVETTNTDGVVTAAAERVVAFGTGRLLDIGDVANTAVQSAYVLRDSGTAISAASWRTAAAMPKQTLTKVSGSAGDTYTIAGPEVDLGTQAGWYVDFDRNTGERINLDPKIVLGTLTMVTNIPSSSSSCSVGGTANIYGLDLCTGRAVGEYAGKTLSNNAGVVGFINITLSNGASKTIATTATGETKVEDHKPAAVIPTRRAGWRRVRE